MAADWYYMVDAGAVPQGPVSSSELKALAQRGAITTDSLVRRGHASAWSSASKVNGLLNPITSPPPVPLTEIEIPSAPVTVRVPRPDYRPPCGVEDGVPSYRALDVLAALVLCAAVLVGIATGLALAVAGYAPPGESPKPELSGMHLAVAGGAIVVILLLAGLSHLISAFVDVAQNSRRITNLLTRLDSAAQYQTQQESVAK